MDPMGYTYIWILLKHVETHLRTATEAVIERIVRQGTISASFSGTA